ncbi:MAG: SDR family NAD(P)-dependent oxidoreductase [Acidimicrobiia bacterium]
MALSSDTSLLEGRVVLVTGAGRGLGRAHARTIAEHGARVVVNDVEDADACAADLRADGLEVVAEGSDVSSWVGAERAVHAALEHFGALHGLVNNAGVTRRADVADLTEAGLDRELGVNLRGAFACTHHASAYWRAQNRQGRCPDASVVHTTSDAVFTAAPGGSGYAATKAGIIALAEAASIEGGQYGVRHNAVAPSGRTIMAASSGLLGYDESEVGLPEQQDPDSPENPLHNSPLVAWLLSTEARHVTGQVFRIRHGAVARVERSTTGPWQLPPDGASCWPAERIGELVDGEIFGSRLPAPTRTYPDGRRLPFARLDHR